MTDILNLKTYQDDGGAKTYLSGRLTSIQRKEGKLELERVVCVCLKSQRAKYEPDELSMGAHEHLACLFKKVLAEMFYSESQK